MTNSFKRNYNNTDKAYLLKFDNMSGDSIHISIPNLVHLIGKNKHCVLVFSNLSSSTIKLSISQFGDNVSQYETNNHDIDIIFPEIHNYRLISMVDIAPPLVNNILYLPNIIDDLGENKHVIIELSNLDISPQYVAFKQKDTGTAIQTCPTCPTCQTCPTCPVCQTCPECHACPKCPVCPPPRACNIS